MSDSSTPGLLNLLPLMDTSDDSLDLPGDDAEDRIRSSLKDCRTCKKGKVFVWQKFVNCRDCRAKNKEKEDLKRARRLARMAVLQNTSDNIPPEASSSVRGSSPPAYVKKAKTAKKSVQLRESKYLRDLEGEEKEVAVMLMKSHVTRLVIRKGPDAYVRPVPGANAGTEYLNATALYNALKACISDSAVKPAFKGFHIVVASDEADHKKKVELVTRDLRKIVRMPFNHAEPILKQRTKNETMRNATYQCNCMGFAAPPATPSPSSSLPASSSSDRLPKKPKLSSSGGNLMEYMRSLKKVKEEEELELERQRALAAEKSESGKKRPVECGGKVKIQVQEDRSHPYGIVGQKISVTVEHA